VSFIVKILPYNQKNQYFASIHLTLVLWLVYGTTGPLVHGRWIWQQAGVSLIINFARWCETERKEVANLSYSALQTGKDISADVPRSCDEDTGKNLRSESLD
jgi:hypothetical protein